MITNMKHIKTQMNLKGIKPTFHRIKIMEYLLNKKNHPTVDMIYADIIKIIPTVSRTTIYNTLNLFIEKDLVKSLIITGTETRYESELFPHNHFLCNKCGKIFDINISDSFTFENQKFIDNNEIKETHCYFKGICKNCLKIINN